MEVYDIIQLRTEVFIIEQNCIYQDCDGKDQHGFHVQGRDTNGVLVSYCRLLPKGISYETYASIGRVITSEKIRERGFGKELMQYAIEKIKALYPNDKIKISAQCYAQVFYENLGFEKTGEIYLEDDIPHIAMIYSA